MIHELKIEPRFFEKVVSGEKTFEIRENDRGFVEGDFVILKEWKQEQYTGGIWCGRITYITDYGQPKGQVVFGISAEGVGIT